MHVNVIADPRRAPALLQLIRSAGHVAVEVQAFDRVGQELSVVFGQLGAGQDVPPIVSWARRARRKQRFAGRIVFVSFLDALSSRRRWSISGTDVPGTTYVRLPVTVRELIQTVLAPAPTLTDEQLDLVIGEHCCSPDEVARLTHDVANGAGRLRQQDASVGEHVSALTDRLQDLASILSALHEHALAERARRLVGACIDVNLDAVAVVFDDACRLALDVNAACCGDRDGIRWSPGGDMDAPAPTGFSLLIVDDDGCRDEFQTLLRELGYAVSVCRNQAEALEVHEADPHSVVVSDLTLGENPHGGRELFRALRATSAAPLLVAISSSARLPPEIRPVVDGFCCGPLAKGLDGAKRLHAVVSTLARTGR